MLPQTFDGHDINDGSDYSARFPAESGGWGLPSVQANLVERSGRWPVVSGLRRRGHTVAIEIEIVDLSNLVDLRDQLMDWLDVDEPAALVITDSDGSSRERFVYAQPIKVVPWSARLANVFVILFQIHGDVKWRAETADTDSWNITASGQTKALSNGGDADAFPILTITPTSSNPTGYAYKRWVPVRWRISEGFTNYPYDLTDGGFNTAALVSGGKAQSDGDDFRVWVDGVEDENRWFGLGLYAFNQLGTLVWVNLDFEANVELTLKTAIAGSGSVDSIEVNEDITAMPDEGILLIDSEAFVYTSKNNSEQAFYNVTRAAKGTSMAAHAVDTDVYWIQHDIWFLYGNPSAGRPDTVADYKPAFSLANSGNTSWDYDDFGEDDGLRTGGWYRSSPYPYCYTGNQGADNPTWAEIGLYVPAENNTSSAWWLYNPCGITNANFQNGEKYASRLATWALMNIISSDDGLTWDVEYEIPVPSTAATWESWSRNEALNSGACYVGLDGARTGISSDCYVEAADVTLTLDSSNVPTTSFIGSEQGNYVLDATIENTTTGESISLLFNMELNEDLEVDTDAKAIVYLKDGSNQFQALTLEGGARRDWLALDPGSNTIQFTDANTGNVTIDFEWRKRWR